MLLIRYQRYPQLVLVPEGFLRLDGIGRNADHVGPGLRELALQPGEVLGLSGAAGGIGARVEKQHQLAAGIIGERNRVAAIAGQAEARGLAALDGRGRGLWS